MIEPPTTVDETLALLGRGRYVADRGVGTALFLALKLGRPLFLEGDAGVGKTELAKVIAGGLDRRLIRLQCYEGLDVASAVYEWDYARQMMELRLFEVTGERDKDKIAKSLFSPAFLIKRPLLQALEPSDKGPSVLLIDELDRADEPFEAFLLEALSEYQITVPELGPIRAEAPPIVIITSNRTREIHDALKRRCLYCFIGYPSAEREMEIVRAKVPNLPEALSRQVVGVIQRLRDKDLFKAPGVAETIDWANALLALDKAALDPETVGSTLGVVLKYQDDIAKVTSGGIPALLAEVG